MVPVEVCKKILDAGQVTGSLTHMNATTQAQFDKIVAGKTYPHNVKITEDYKGKKMVVSFNMQSYFVGMYCAMYLDGKLASQTGDHNNKGFVTKLRKDILAADKRGAEIEISGIDNIKTN